MSGIVGAGEVRFAGFWIRVAAALVDGFVLGLVTAFIAIVVVFALVAAGMDEGVVGTLSQILTTVAGIAYYVGFHSSRAQATPGKRVLGIHVMTRDGGRLTPMRAFGRYCALILSAIPVGLGYVMAGLTREKTALHDLVCSTRVVHGAAVGNPAELSPT
ncbi:transporter [Skermanella stibiiresistens SB22]|uniref:Transporter n=1 Tax=Skermanella stibiiresistens SB22 TaxID=1385369 RepID=W9GZ66_9PROT|nr:RDD family protein [Skermanella stibiiresistens]EWY39210.1 transporter [Skermanella stibiiresistens SB22]